MPSAPVSAPPSPSPPVAELCRELLGERISMLEGDALCLRIPKVQDQLRPVPGMHFHLTPEVLLQVSGHSVMNLPSERVRFAAGEVCVLPRGVPHVETARGRDDGVHNIVIAYHTQTVSFQVNGCGGRGRPRVRAFEHFDAPQVRRLTEYLDDAVEAFNSDSSGRRARVKGAMLAHLSSLLDVLDGACLSSRQEPFKVLQCRHLVSQNLTDPTLSVQRLADWIQCAPDYLSHLFHVEAGEPLAAYINRQRVDHAKRLLDVSSLNISEIARASGYADPGYFTRVFRRFVGETPRAYRKRLTEGLQA